MAAASWCAVMASSNRRDLPQGDAEVVERRALAVTVAGLAEDGGRVLAGGDGLFEPPHLYQGAAKAVQRCAFAVAVAGLAVDRRPRPGAR